MTYTSPGRHQQHVTCTWEGFLAIHRYEDLAVIRETIEGFQPARIVEFGTHQGGMAAFFSRIVEPWGGEVLSVDREMDPGIAQALTARYANLTLLTADLLGTFIPEAVGLWLAEPQTLLYCDNGHKEQEVALYGDLLAPPGLLGVHDYGTEVNPEWIEPWAATHGYRPHRHETFARLANADYWDSLTRFWLRA